MHNASALAPLAVSEVAPIALATLGNAEAGDDYEFGEAEEAKLGDDDTGGEATLRFADELLPNFEMIADEDVEYTPGQVRLGYVAAALTQRGLSADSATQLAAIPDDFSPYFPREQ